MQPAAGRRLRVKDLCVVLVFAGAVVSTLTSRAAAQSQLMRDADLRARELQERQQRADCDRKASEAAARVEREKDATIKQLRDAHRSLEGELKEARTAGERLSRELDGVQAQLDSVREDHDADGRKHASHKQELAEEHERVLKEEALKAENALSSCRNDLELLRRSSHATEDDLRKVKAERDAERATSIDLRKALDDALATLEEKRAVIDAASRLAELSLGAAAPATKKKAKRRKDSPIEPLERIIDEKKSDVAALARDVAALARTGGQAPPEERDLAALLEGVDGGAAIPAAR
jgi:chromosome segregation ATPase